MSTQPLPTPVAAPPPSEGQGVTTALDLRDASRACCSCCRRSSCSVSSSIYPAYYTIRLAFYEGDFNFGFFHYLGLDNFKHLLTNDPDFLDLSKFHGSTSSKSSLQERRRRVGQQPPLGHLLHQLRRLSSGLGSPCSRCGSATSAPSRRRSSCRWRSRRPPSGSSGSSSTARTPTSASSTPLIDAFDSGFHPIAWLGRSEPRQLRPDLRVRLGVGRLRDGRALRRDQGDSGRDHGGGARRRRGRVEHLPAHHVADAQPAALRRDDLALHQRDQGLRHHLRHDRRRPRARPAA